MATSQSPLKLETELHKTVWIHTTSIFQDKVEKSQLRSKRLEELSKLNDNIQKPPVISIYSVDYISLGISIYSRMAPHKFPVAQMMELFPFTLWVDRLIKPSYGRLQVTSRLLNTTSEK